MEIVFKDFGTHLGARVHGVEVRKRIVDAINSGEKVIFNFSGVETISNSFADECFAKLTLLLSMEQIKNNSSFILANSFVRSVIANSFKERLSQLEHA